MKHKTGRDAVIGIKPMVTRRPAGRTLQSKNEKTPERVGAMDTKQIVMNPKG